MHPGTRGRRGFPTAACAGRFPLPQSQQRWFPNFMHLQASLSQDTGHRMLPKVSGIPWSALSDQMMGAGWVMMQSCKTIQESRKMQCLPLWDSADMQGRQAHLLWCTGTLYVRQFWFLLRGSAHRPLQSQSKAFPLTQDPGQYRSSQAVSLYTGFILRLMASGSKAHGFTLAKQAEIYIFFLPS